jgi:hypothetical protein
VPFAQGGEQNRLISPPKEIFWQYDHAIELRGTVRTEGLLVINLASDRDLSLLGENSMALVMGGWS